MYIKYLAQVGDNPIGRIVHAEDETKAKGLIAAGLVAEVEEPAELKAKRLAASGSAPNLSELIGQAVAKQIEPLTNMIKAGAPPTVPEDRKVYATAKRFGKLKNFKNTEEGYRAAFRFGHFVRAAYGKYASSREFCEKNGMPMQVDMDGVSTKASGDSPNTSSGFLVPDEFSNDIIDLREMYGVFRANADVTPMTRDVKFIPRRKGGTKAYFVMEGVAGTQADKTWDNVQLISKKLMCLSTYSNELAEDAIINIGDDLAGEFAYAFAFTEDACGFIGDGTSTYGGIVGVTNALLNVSPGNISNVSGLTVMAATGGWTSAALSDFNATVGTLPQYAYRSNDVAWYCSQAFWGNIMQKLAMAAGGNRVADIVNGVPQYSFAGFPVRITQVMPSSTAVNQVVALFGNLRMAATMGDRRSTTIAVSDSAGTTFQQDQLMMRGTERFDIKVHDVGQAKNAVARDPVTGLVQAGPIVGLVTASS